MARQYLSSLTEFNETAKHWTEAFANSEQVVTRSAKVQRIKEMGFDEAAATAALEKAAGDEQAAMELLLAG